MNSAIWFGLTFIIWTLVCQSAAAAGPAFELNRALQCEQALLGSPPQYSSPEAEVIRSYRQIIEEITAVPGKRHFPEFENRWSCVEGGCVSLSYQIQKILKVHGYPVKRIAVKNVRPVPARNAPNGAFHYFVIDDVSVPGVEIIIDPTYKQFFSQPSSDPDIFVGTRDDIETLYRRRESDIRGDYITMIMSFDPVATSQMNYGYGTGAKDREGNVTRSFESD